MRRRSRGFSTRWRSRTIVLLTGEIGSGKTTLSRAFIDSLDESYHPLLIINPRLSPSQLLRTVALRLGMEDAEPVPARHPRGDQCQAV